MQKRIVCTVIFLALIKTTIAHAGWFYMITPPNGGPSFPVGPYKNLSNCRDMLGSALFAHPFACHLGKPQCQNIGNGFAYPKDFAYPVSADDQIPSNDCFQDNTGSLGQRRGWYFLFYTATGGSIEKCSSYKYFADLATKVPGDEVANYSDMRCPGAPCFSVGFDTACE